MLTTVEVRSIKPAARPFKVRDDKGLFLLVQPSGALLWRFRYKAFGVERKLSLGSFPKVTLKQAREKRDAARAQLVDGVGEQILQEGVEIRLGRRVAGDLMYLIPECSGVWDCPRRLRNVVALPR